MLFNGTLTTDSITRQKIRDFYRIDEDLAVEHILPDAEVNMRARSRAWDRARKMVLQIRQDQEGNGVVEALLNEYSLSSAEGVVLMCLAEALLRVPDKHTQDKLISDKLSKGQWSSHLGNSDSLFVNASSWGLLMTGGLVNYANQQNRFGPNGDLMIQKRQLIQPIQDQIFAAVQDIASTKKFDFIFDKSADVVMLYSAERYDISEQVLRTITRTSKRTQAKNKKERKALEDEAVVPEVDKAKDARRKALDDKRAAAEKKLEVVTP